MANCVGDSGYTSGETIRSSAVAAAALARQVAAAAIAIDNANRLIDNYKDQRDISQRSLDIAREQQNQLRTVFWPREAQFLAEFSTPEAVEAVEVMGARYAGRLVSTVAGTFAAQLKDARCSFRRYCTSANHKLIQDLLAARAVAMANARVLGRNIAYAEFQARNDMNLSRRMQAVALGRGLINQAMSLYQAAGRGLANAGETLAGQFNTAFEAFGYYNQERRAARGRLDELQMADSNIKTPDVARMPGTVPPQTFTKFGLESSMERMRSLDASDVMKGDESGLSATSKPNVFKDLQSEKHNDSKIGNNDLAPSGRFTFPVIGAPGTVTIDMSVFPLKYVDDKTEGDFV